MLISWVKVVRRGLSLNDAAGLESECAESAAITRLWLFLSNRDAAS